MFQSLKRRNFIGCEKANNAACRRRGLGSSRAIFAKGGSMRCSQPPIVATSLAIVFACLSCSGSPPTSQPPADAGDAGAADAGGDAGVPFSRPPYGTYVQTDRNVIGIVALSIRPPETNGESAFLLWERVDSVIERSYRGLYGWIDPSPDGGEAQFTFTPALSDPTKPPYRVAYRWEPGVSRLTVGRMTGQGTTTLTPDSRGICSETRDCLKHGTTLESCDAGRPAWVCSADFYCVTVCLP